MSLLLPFLCDNEPENGENFCEEFFDDLFEEPRHRFMPYVVVPNRLNSNMKRRLKSKLKRPIGSTVDKNNYKVNLDVQHFDPDEINVKVIGDNTISIEAKHEEKQDEKGFVSRHFVSKYTLPEGFDINKVQSKLSSDGVLAITAPKIIEKEVQSREIPIIRSVESSKSKNLEKDKTQSENEEQLKE